MLVSGQISVLNCLFVCRRVCLYNLGNIYSLLLLSLHRGLFITIRIKLSLGVSYASQLFKLREGTL